MLILVFDFFLSLLVLHPLDAVLYDLCCRFFFHLLLLFILQEFSLFMFMMLMQIVQRMSGLSDVLCSFSLSFLLVSACDMHAILLDHMFLSVTCDLCSVIVLHFLCFMGLHWQRRAGVLLRV